MANFGGAKGGSGGGGGFGGVGVAGTFYRESATSGLYAPGSVGSQGINTPEEALARRPYMNLGKTSINMLGGASPTVMAPVEGPVPMPTDIGPITKRDLSPIEMAERFMQDLVMPFLAPGSGQLQQTKRAVDAWHDAMNGDDPILAKQAALWKAQIDGGLMDTAGALSGFYEQYLEITEAREGRSSALWQTMRPTTMKSNPLEAAGSALVDSALKPMMFLQNMTVRTLSSGTDFSADRVEETMLEYSEPAHGRLTPELVSLTEAYKKGELSEDEFRDHIILAGFGLTNPEPMGKGSFLNAPVSLALEVFSDPINIPLVGAGTVARMSTTAAGKVVLPNVLRLFADDGISIAAKAAGKDVAEFVGTAAGEEAQRGAAMKIATEIEQMVAKMKPNVAPKRRTDLDRVEAIMELIHTRADLAPVLQKGMDASGMTGLLVTRAPKIIKLGYSIDKALDPLTIFNRSRAGERAKVLTSHLFSEGYYDALGWRNVGRLDSLMRAAGVSQQTIDTLDGRAAMNYALQVGNEQNIRHTLKKQGYDMTANPTAAARETVERNGGDVRKMMREHVDRTLEYIVATERGGAKAAETTWRARSVKYLVNMGATQDAAEAAAKQMNERQMRALAVRHWAHIIGELDTAVTKAVKTPEFGADKIARVTNLGPRQMTAADLRALVKVAEAKKGGYIAVVMDAVNRFDDLRFNINTTQDPDDIVKAVLKLLAKLEGTLPTAIEDTSILPASLQAYLKEYASQGYSLGLRPTDENLSKAIRDDATDQIIGLSSWIDNVTEGTAAVKVGRARQWQNTLFRGIGGSEIERSAGRRFTQYMAEELGLSPSESREIMRTIKDVAEINQTSPRGLQSPNVARAIADTRLKAGLKKTIPTRRVIDAIAFAYENELGRVGASQMFTGKVKRHGVGLWDNWMGWVAESLYPMVRFTKSPIFVLQELTEYPYFMALRGMFPWRHNLPGHGNQKLAKQIYDEKTLFLMDYFKSADTFVKSDMIEQSDLVRMGFMASRRLSDSKGRFGRAMQTITGTHLYRSKAEAEAVVWREQMGRYMKDAMMEESPATWYAVRAAARKNASDGEVAVEWLHDLVARGNPDGVWSKMSPEMFRPGHLGRRSRLSSQLIGYVIGGEEGANLSWKKLRKRVADPKDSLDADFVAKELERAGADANYVARTREALEFPDADDFYDSMLKLGLPKVQVDAMRASDELDASRLGVGLQSYLSSRWVDSPQSIDQFGDQHGNYMFQLIVDALESRGLVAPAKDSPLLEQLRALGDEKAWKWPDPDADFVGRKVKDLTPDEAAGRKKAVEARNARQLRQNAADVNAANKTNTPRRGDPPNVAGAPLYKGSRHTIGKPSYEDWVRQLEAVFPSKGDRVEMADWYLDMQRGMLALFSGQPTDQQVASAARMIVGFAVTQANTSPADGMQYLYRVLSMARRGEDWPSAAGLQGKDEIKQMLQRVGGLNQKQLDELIVQNGDVMQDGIGQKLTDFIDSLIGNRRRSVGVDGPDPNHPWGPVAGDVWAKRDMGYLDEKLGDKLHLVIDDVMKKADGTPDPKAVTTVRAAPTGKIGKDGKPVKGKVIAYRVPLEDGTERVFEQVGSSVPDQYEYDSIVEYYNGLADYLNETGYLRTEMGGREWTSADAQAMGWFKAKTVYGDSTGDPRSAFFKGRWSAGTEIRPTPGTQLDEIVPWSELSDDSMRLIHDDVVTSIVEEAASMSGVNITMRRSTIGITADGRIVPSHMVEILADRGAAEQYLSRQAFYSHADSAMMARSLGDQKYDQAAGITGAIEMLVTDKAEGEAILRALAGKDTLPKGAHLVLTDDNKYVVRAVWEGTGDKNAFKREFPLKSVMAALEGASGRAVKQTDVARPTVEVIRVTNNWKERPDGGAYLDIAGRGAEYVSDGRRTVQRVAGEVREMERIRQHGIVLRAEDSVQKHVPREAATARTLDQLDPPRDRLVRDLNESLDAGDTAGARAIREQIREFDADYRRRLGADLNARGRTQRQSISDEDWAAWNDEYDRLAAEGAPDPDAPILTVESVQELPAVRGQRHLFSDEFVIESNGGEFLVDGIETRFDPATGAWLAYYINPSGKQVGDLLRVRSEKSLKMEVKRMIRASARGYEQERRYGTIPTLVANTAELRPGIIPAGTVPEGAKVSTLHRATLEQDALYRSYMDDLPGQRLESNEIGPPKAGSCDQVGWSGRYNFPEPCMDVTGHTGQHFWHHMDGMVEVWDEGIPMENLQKWGIENGGIQFQRAPKGTRAAIVREQTGRHDQMYFAKGKTREDTILHELVHKFANDLDPSAVRRVKGIRAAAEGHTLGAHGAADTSLTMDDQEWLVEQYLAWAKDGSTVHPTLEPLLSAFRESIKGKRGQAKATLHPDMKTFLDEQAAAASARPVTPAHYDVDEEAMFNQAMVGHRRASKDARDLIHFRGERSLVERSMNHPFFGMYPLSYMWGKVLPELAEFLMFRPFGLKMPGVAFNTTNRMYQSFMHQQAYDEELRQYLYENEPAMRAMSMFIPGVPWDLPVNAPLWARRLVEAIMTNQQRELEGKEPLDIDVGKIISDVAGYQFGVARSATTVPEALGAAVAAPGIIGRAMGGDAPLPVGEGHSDPGPFSPPDIPLPEMAPEEQYNFDLNAQIKSLSSELAGAIPPSP